MSLPGRFIACLACLMSRGQVAGRLITLRRVLRQVTWTRLLGVILGGLSVVPGSAEATSTMPPALVIANAGYSSLPTAPACLTRTHALTPLLARSGHAVMAVEDGTATSIRAAIQTFAAAVRDRGRVGPQDDLAAARPLIYVCSQARALDSRLFILPVVATGSDGELLTQGILLKSLINVLAGTDGTLLADVALPPAPDPSAAITSLTNSLERSHVVLEISRRGEPTASLAGALAGGAVDPDAAWSALSASLAARTDLANLTRLPQVGASPTAAGSTTGTAMAPTGPGSVAVDQVASPPPAGSTAATTTSTTGSASGKTDSIPRTPAVQAHAATNVKAAASAPRRGSDQARRAAQLLPAEVSLRRDPRIRRLQVALLALGFYDSSVSGVFDPETARAVRSYQRSIHETPTGRPTSSQIIRLMNTY